MAEEGVPGSIITDHGTQFKGRVWRETLLSKGVRTFKTSVYHPSSNPAERVLREVGRILRTYCHQQQRKWEEYLPAAEDFINLAYHQAIDTTPFTAMFERRPPREIIELIEFPPGDDYTFDQVKFYNKTVERAEKMREKYKKQQPKIIQYKMGELVLLKNRELPSTLEGIFVLRRRKKW